MILKYLNTRFFISKYFATPDCLNSIVHIFIQKKPPHFFEICYVKTSTRKDRTEIIHRCSYAKLLCGKRYRTHLYFLLPNIEDTTDLSAKKRVEIEMLTSCIPVCTYPDVFKVNVFQESIVHVPR